MDTLAEILFERSLVVTILFSRQKSPIKTSPVKRKVQILPSNIKLNVGNGKAEPNTEETATPERFAFNY